MRTFLLLAVGFASLAALVLSVLANRERLGWIGLALTLLYCLLYTLL